MRSSIAFVLIVGSDERVHNSARMEELIATSANLRQDPLSRYFATHATFLALAGAHPKVGNQAGRTNVS